jgi:glutaredoxin
MFLPPTSHGFTIYTKVNCSYCDKVKTLLEKHVFFGLENIAWVPVDMYLASSREAFLHFIDSFVGDSRARTFPMVFYNGEYIGGFTETREWLKQYLY